MGVLFFNWYGYQLLSNYWQNCAERGLEASFDQNNYDKSALISFKVPLTSLSYYNSSPGFERVNGQIDIAGVRYQYVKRRIFGDSLEVLCLPNMTSMKLRTASNDFFRQVNDLQQQNQGKRIRLILPRIIQKTIARRQQVLLSRMRSPKRWCGLRTFMRHRGFLPSTLPLQRTRLNSCNSSV